MVVHKSKEECTRVDSIKGSQVLNPHSILWSSIAAHSNKVRFTKWSNINAVHNRKVWIP